ncbi:MAG: HAD family phosphatase [Anaerolineae bacterium]|jgi:putative hydrolase of the HAD superfamily|nr:HAD family phosphatase [Anaerolineae bacterium]
MTIRAVIFDFGGVIVRTEDQSPRLRWAERLGVTPAVLGATVFDSEAAAQATVGRIPAAAVWAHVAAAFKLEADALAQLRADFFSGDRCDEALVAFLRGLRPAYKTGILSNAWSDGRDIIGGKFALADAVDDLVVSAEVGMAKPDPRIYELATTRLGVRPEEAIFVDDFARNIDGARKFGMQAVHFRDRTQAIADVQALLTYGE